MISPAALLYQPAIFAIMADSLPSEVKGRGISAAQTAATLSSPGGPPLAAFLVGRMELVPAVRLLPPRGPRPTSRRSDQAGAHGDPEGEEVDQAQVDPGGVQEGCGLAEGGSREVDRRDLGRHGILQPGGAVHPDLRRQGGRHRPGAVELIPTVVRVEILAGINLSCTRDLQSPLLRLCTPGLCTVGG